MQAAVIDFQRKDFKIPEQQHRVIFFVYNKKKHFYHSERTFVTLYDDILH